MIVLLLILSLFLVLVEACQVALTSYSRHRLELYSETRRPGLLGEVLTRDDECNLALRVWRWLIMGGIACSLWWIAQGISIENGSAVTIRVVLISFAVVLIELWIAEPLGQVFAEPLIFHAWPMISLLRVTAYPITKVCRLVVPLFRVLAGQHDTDPQNSIQEEILTVVNEGEREGQLEETAAGIIQGLMQLHEVAVTEIMTPRPNIIMLKDTATIADASNLIAECGHSRIPICGETRDEIKGVLYAKDLMTHLLKSDKTEAKISSLKIRKPIFVTTSKPVDDLLREFQRDRMHIAIVTDDYEGVAGIVTIEDILELIVGDITDEHDPSEAPPIRTLEDGIMDVDARVRVFDLNEEMSVAIPESQDYDTVGGFVVATLGRVPDIGESFEMDGSKFTILDASDRAVNRVRIARLSPESAESK